MKRYSFIVLALLLAILLSACGGKKGKEKNIQQIQKDQGMPVRIQALEPQTYLQQLRYNALLGGLEESTAQANLSEAVSGIHAKVGDRVQKGQVIISFPTTAPAAMYEQASAAYAAQKQVYDRMKRLYEKGAISRQELDNLETSVKVSKANLDSSEQMIKVRAPISGIITAINVNLSERVYPGKDLFTVSASTGYKAVIMVPDKDVSLIKKGAEVTASVNGETIKGRVTEIGMALDMYTRALRVEASFSGMNKKISYGSNAQICITVFSKPNCLVLNREHIQYDNGQAFVWLNENNHAVRRNIETGLNDQLKYEVVSGLSQGDQLVTEGGNLLSENTLLRVIDQGE